MQKLVLFLIFLFAFTSFAQTADNFDIQGHRGARGLIPENTIPSFLKAIELGADTIELDVVISADKKIVVSHEAWFSSVISLDKNGKPIPAEKQKENNIYRMKYSEIKLFDVGSLGHKDFPDQRKIKVHKPLLKEVFKAVEKYVRQNKIKPIKYNIEIKSGEKEDEIFHPAPPEFAKLVYDEILKNKMEKRVIVQSFDVRPLQELRKFPIKLPIALLIGNKDGIEKNLARLGFQPESYNPHFSLIDEASVKYCHERNVKIVPWTVNEIADLERMKKFDLDGIITDYPDRAVKVFRRPEK